MLWIIELCIVFLLGLVVMRHYRDDVPLCLLCDGILLVLHHAWRLITTPFKKTDPHLAQGEVSDGQAQAPTKRRTKIEATNGKEEVAA